ncbi:hypothetical protein Y1Q_0001312 [Alligator mississippiensis]|uniref:Uncharacterized protein n=1 Tax=Alligator mississippiensis TaxID=8496 RepID=A0A151M918_ALLMI|nr:hypothetical protein Y1Q_0001312 [Alligator mississippiensis]
MCKSFVGERKQGEELEHGPWGSRRSGDGGSRMVCAAWCHHGRCKEEPDSSRVKIRGKRAARTHGGPCELDRMAPRPYFTHTRLKPQCHPLFTCSYHCMCK